jgi:hypothetical protein
MYDVDRINRLLPSVTGRQSDDSRSEVSAKNSRLLTFEFLIIRQEGLEPPAVEHEVVHLLRRARECCVEGDFSVVLVLLAACALRPSVALSVGGLLFLVRLGFFDNRSGAGVVDQRGC